MEPLMPIGIASLATVLKKYGYNVELFDTTLYPDTSHNDQKDRILSKQIKSADYACYGVQPKTTDMLDDFKKYVENFKPNLIAVSCVECTYTLSLKLLNQIKGKKIPTIMGGVFATFSPEYILHEGCMDPLKHIPSVSLFHPSGPLGAQSALFESIKRRGWKPTVFLETGLIPKNQVERIVPDGVTWIYRKKEHYSITILNF